MGCCEQWTSLHCCKSIPFHCCSTGIYSRQGWLILDLGNVHIDILANPAAHDHKLFNNNPPLQLNTELYWSLYCNCIYVCIVVQKAYQSASQLKPSLMPSSFFGKLCKLGYLTFVINFFQNDFPIVMIQLNRACD